ncbi:Uncharacterized protein OBRU01_21925 [Operophtera brumata]|uniref:Uncharacterized protein n=1 Tax=Operophtera brumata TaxID=104452 RepID=A0A0L7KSI0_OPEBR|nr:Uncharacterized protein OBRU01_21925 [Operophtera brumata]
MKSSMLLLACATLAVAIPPPHPDVVQVRLEEERLPHHLRKPALHNPNLRDVFNREAHSVSRKEIYNILTHAGLLSRTDNRSSQQLRHQPAIVRGHDPDILPFLQSQDLLQYL